MGEKKSWKRKRSNAAKMETANGRLPRSLDEVTGIIGYGNIKARSGLGHPTSVRPYPQASHGTFHELYVEFKKKNKKTRNSIHTAELGAMQWEAAVISVSRGNVMSNVMAIKALRENPISGVAVGVFDREPVSILKDSAFLSKELKALSVAFSTYAAYFSNKSVVTMKAMVGGHIKNHIAEDFGNIRE
ncbi:hypothetical protein O1611_g1510 [Lasiodiplodia mahajangana]|uniref:Uncharacterized protein n=1 Tax=Lasiodiplodia mahajangana TaxID=1108764 RepID=A0ACC2JXQ5_9PEZI|nr:hypothetical protein O1611_g1510 [Lasiodiplodia mahajangana]